MVGSGEAGNFGERPDVVSDPSFHRRRDPERLVNPGEVVMHEVERDGCLVVVHLLPRRRWSAG